MTASPLLGQDPPLTIGAKAFDPVILKPYDNVWRFDVRLPSGATRTQGLWTDRLEQRQVDGKRRLVRVQGMTYANGLTSSTVNVFEADNLAPVSSLGHRPDGSTIRREFAGATVVTTVHRPMQSDSTVSRAELPLQVVDFWGGMYGLLLAALPLHIGYAGSLAAIDENADSLYSATFRVTGRAPLAVGTREFATWIVEVPGPGYRMRFWIAKEAPYIIRLEMDYSNGNHASWNMIGQPIGAHE